MKLNPFCNSLFLGFALLLPNAGAAAQVTPPAPKAAVFLDELPGANPALARELAGTIAEAGYATEFINRTSLADTNFLNKDKFALLVLTSARSLPITATTCVESYLRSGGHMIAAGLPAWHNAYFQINNEWISRQAYEGAVVNSASSRVLFNFAQEDIKQWLRASDDPRSKMHSEIVANENARALHVTIEHLTGWDTLCSPALQRDLAPAEVLTCFRAKGDGKTPRLAIEWRERNGSRWMATVDLTSEWKSYVLLPEDFQRWPDPAGPKHHLEMTNATQLVIGLAMSHTPMLQGHHEYWIENIGVAPHPFGHERLPDTKVPEIETFSPAYAFYPMTGKIKLSIPAEVAWMPARRTHIGVSLPNGTEILAMHPRPRSASFEQRRPWRWQPLLEAYAPNGEYRGTIASLAINSQGEFAGGIWACFTPDEISFYKQPGIQALIRETAAAMKRGIFLREGGAEFFTVFENQTLHLGARVVNFTPDAQRNLLLRLTVKSSKGGKPLFSREWPVQIPAAVQSSPSHPKQSVGERAGERRFLGEAQELAFEESWKPTTWPEGGMVVTTELIQRSGSDSKGDRVIDRLTHELNVWRPKKNPEFVTIRDGQFWLKGKPWKVHGVNYMPSSGIGLRGPYFEFWIGRGAYDPVVIERDLRRIKGMGLNAVSIFIYHGSLDAQHLLDLLRRCENLGLKVNQSLRPGTPMDFRWHQMKELIEYYRMAENDTIFAYDLAWEPSHRVTQKEFSEQWSEWVKKKYGNEAEAQKSWGIPVPHPEDNSGQIAVPTTEQFTRDGEWRRFVCAFRLFLDELVATNYAEARRLVKSIDPNHAVSFRMSLAGDPTANVEDVVPYDFYGLKDAVDIWEPEAYGRIGDWERVKGGRFTADYARLCDPAKPLLWAEMGYTIWDVQRMKENPETVQFMARYTSDFYRMLTESGANGIFFWWYPGGFRVGENSDFGIINPDGTDRPMTKIIRTEGQRFLSAPKPKTPDWFISVDRNKDARGLFGLYTAAQAEYWNAIKNGKNPALRWADKPDAPQAK